MLERGVIDKTLRLARRLRGCDVPFAIGGAIALGYHAEPRSTQDIDVNVLVPFEQAGDVLDCLADLGVEATESHRAAIASEYQARIPWEGTMVDLFFAFSPYHRECQSRVRTVALAGAEIPILSAEDLIIFKVLFNRPKDWGDIADVVRLRGQQLDSGYCLGWLEEFLGARDSAVARLRELLPGA